MQHSFDISIAQRYGVNVAIFLNNLAFWIHKNVANNKNFHDDHHWTYNSQEAFLQLFPYWTRQALRTVLKKCGDEDLVITGNYNKTQYDRKCWYAFTSKGLDLFPMLKSIGCNQPMERLESTNQLVGINQPIADSKTDNKTKREHTRKKRVPLPDDFEPSEEAKATAEAKGLDLIRVISKFRAHAKSEGWKRIDWHEAFMKWVIDEKIDKKIVTATNVRKIEEPARPRLRDFTQERIDRERGISHGSEVSGNNTRGTGVQKAEGYLF